MNCSRRARRPHARILGKRTGLVQRSDLERTIHRMSDSGLVIPVGSLDELESRLDQQERDAYDEPTDRRPVPNFPKPGGPRSRVLTSSNAGGRGVDVGVGRGGQRVHGSRGL